MYSQNDEERVILDGFGWTKNKEGVESQGRTGRFLDIGAYTGKELSNTRALMERGWGGVCVEPNPNSFNALMRNCQPFPKVQLVNAAIAAQGGFLRFFACGDAVSTTDEAHRAKWAAGGVPYQAIHVRSVSMVGLLSAFPPPYDFFNLDVEGTNWTVFNTVPLDHLAAKLMCIEFDDHRKEIEARCREHGYMLVHGTTENMIFAKK